MVKARKVIQLAFLFLFFWLFLKARYPYEPAVSSDVLLRTSPLSPLFYFIDNLSLPLLFWPAIVILLLTPFLGRFFCGWICPLGTSLDLSDKILRPPSNKKNPQLVKFRWIKYGILTMMIVLAIFSFNLWSYLDPLAIFTRITTVVVYPVFTLISEQSILAITQISFLEDISYSVYDWYKAVIMPENQAFVQGIVTIFVLASIIFGLEKLSRRLWCRNICPAGALLGFLSQFRFYERLVGDACPVCNKCQVECKMNAIPAGNVKQTLKTECIECFNCGELCPPKSKAITYRFKLKPYHTKPDFSRRKFLGTAAGGVTALSLFSIGFIHKTDSSFTIRPPGSLPESEFLDRCIRCLECVRICQSNGACLQPAGFENHLEHLWTPVAKMREGYCEYNCNLCGAVCPTDAILPLPLATKQKAPMGLAYFDKDLCIPYERNEDCIVCEEHCPTPDKAIKFDIKNVTMRDGTERKVKYPYVVRSLCIGCGICEHKCPLPAKPGVYVIRENEMRWNGLNDPVA